MLTTDARTQAWLADLAAINAEIDTHGIPSPAPVARKRRSRKLKPLWEE